MELYKIVPLLPAANSLGSGTAGLWGWRLQRRFWAFAFVDHVSRTRRI